MPTSRPTPSATRKPTTRGCTEDIGHYPHCPPRPSRKRSRSCNPALFRPAHAAAHELSRHDWSPRRHPGCGGPRSASQAAAAALCPAGAVAAVPRPVHLLAGGAGAGRIPVSTSRMAPAPATNFVGLGNYAKVLADPALPPGCAQQPDLRRGRAGADPGAGACLRAGRAALDALLGGAAHGVLLPRWCRWWRRPRCSSSSSCRASACSTTTSPRSGLHRAELAGRFRHRPCGR